MGLLALYVPIVSATDDIGCYYPPGGNWYMMQSSAGFKTTQFGYDGTVPVVGDFNGDGIDDIGCYYAPGGNWYMMHSTAGFKTAQFGYGGTVPVVGDFDGDGIDDIGCYYAPGGNWYMMQSSAGFKIAQFGYRGTVPMAGDFDVDGKDDIGCYFASGGNWYMMQSSVGFKTAQFGYGGTVPVVGDFDGDGNKTYLVVDLSSGPSSTNYPISYLASVPTNGWTDEFKTTNLVFRLIPAGTFTMGSPSNELGRFPNEVQHQVTISQPFYIGVFEVTQKQWERVMGNYPSYYTNLTHQDSRPVEHVNYYAIRGTTLGTNWPASRSVDANSFMGSLRARTGMTFDLPTESQWEYAGRAGTVTALNSGQNLTNTNSDAADAAMNAVGRNWYNGGSVGFTRNGDTSVGSAKVGSYVPNAWGLYDIHGNVGEWCLDWYGTYPDTVTDPLGPTSGVICVVRGGSWHGYPSNGRSATRSDVYPIFAFGFIGFRAALSPGP